jgi:hypothetical protein
MRNENVGGRVARAESKSEMEKAQSRRTESAIEMNRARQCGLIAVRLLAIYSWIALSIEMSGAGLPNRRFSIDAISAGLVSMISTESSANLRQILLVRVGIHELFLPATPIFRKTANLNARASNIFTQFDAAGQTILENQFSGEEKALALPLLGHKEFAIGDCAAYAHDHAQFENCAIDCPTGRTSDKIFSDDAAKFCNLNSRDLIAGTCRPELTTTKATPIHSDTSRDQTIVGRQRIDRDRVRTKFVKQNAAHWKAIVVNV